MKKTMMVFMILSLGGFFAIDGFAKWDKIGGPASNVYMGSYGIFYTQPITGDIYRYNYTPMSWTKIGGRGYTFVVNNNRIFKLSPDRSSVWEYTGMEEKWIQIGGPARTIYAGGNYLYAINPSTGDIYRYNGTPMSWSKIGGPGYMFAADTRYIYGLSPDKSGVWQYTGLWTWWIPIGGPASKIGKIYAGGYIRLLATNQTSGHIYQYEREPREWTRIGGPGYTFVMNNQGLYGLSPDKSGVWHYKSGDQWIQIGGPARMIYAGGNALCATNPATGYIYLY